MPGRCTAKVVKRAKEASRECVTPAATGVWQNTPAHLLPPAQHMGAALEQANLFRMAKDTPSMQWISLAVDFPTSAAAQRNKLAQELAGLISNQINERRKSSWCRAG